jgi:hypothetical protein
MGLNEDERVAFFPIFAGRETAIVARQAVRAAALSAYVVD